MSSGGDADATAAATAPAPPPATEPPPAAPDGVDGAKAGGPPPPPGDPGVKAMGDKIKDAAHDAFEDAFPDLDDSTGPPELLMCGPKKIGTQYCAEQCPRICPCVLALHGPLQLVFLIVAVVSLVCVVFEFMMIGDEENPTDAARILTACFFFASAAYLTWVGKGIYILKWIRLEVVKLAGLNKKLEASIGELVSQNKTYEEHNLEHERLNKELQEQVQELGGQKDSLAMQNVEGKKLNDSLSTQINELGKVERRLETLALECGSEVEEVRSLIGRLERDVRIDTVNTVIQFFDRTDLNKNGKIEEGEINLFVDNLSMLWKHLPGFEKERMRAALVDNEGLTMEQLNEILTEALRLEDDYVKPSNNGGRRVSKWGFSASAANDPPV